MTAGSAGTAADHFRVGRCRRVLHIDWDGDPEPVREDIGRCSREQGHEGNHRTADGRYRW